MKLGTQNSSALKYAVLNIVCGAALMSGCNASAQPKLKAETPEPIISALAIPFNFTSEWVNVTVTGTREANAPNLILLPGLASSSQTWNTLSMDLGKTHKLHSVDVSGFAGTPAKNAENPEVVDGIVRDVSAYIVANNLQNVTIMGHSLGGFTALKLAKELGESLDQIIIVDALPFYPALFNEAATVATSTPQADQMRVQLLAMETSTFEQFQSRSVRIMSKDVQSQKDILQWSMATDRKVMGNAIHNLMIQDMRPQLSEISTNVHVIYAWDAMMGVSKAQIEDKYKSQYKALPNVEFTRVDESFHFIMRDQPQDFLSAVQTVLNTN